VGGLGHRRRTLRPRRPWEDLPRWAVSSALALGALFLALLWTEAWASVTRHGRARTTFATSAPQIFASFTWRRVPTPGQPLAIAWYGPKGTLAAIWKDRTLRRDRPGTVLYASVPRTVYATRPGSWQVVLRVAGISRGAVSLRVRR